MEAIIATNSNSTSNFTLVNVQYNCSFEQVIHLKKMNVGRFALFLSKMAFFKRAWQKVKMLSMIRPIK